MKQNRPTMQEIAEAAGVSQPAVSMALRDHPRISAATRQRIQALAAAMGYRPDPLVSTLMAQRRGKGGGVAVGTVGVVALWPHAKGSWLDLPYYQPYREGLEARLETRGHAVDWFHCDGSAKQVSILMRTLRARGIQGLVIPQAHEDFVSLPFALEGLTAVLIGEGIHQPRLTRVAAAMEPNMRLAWCEVRRRGFRRIGFLTWRLLTSKNDGAWLGAFRQCQQELKASERLAPCELTEMTLEQAIPWMEKHRPEAILSENSGLLIALRKHFPEVAGFTLDRVDGDPTPGVRVRRRQIGASAADAVVAQLNRGERGVPDIPKRILIEGVWEDG